MAATRCRLRKASYLALTDTFLRAVRAASTTSDLVTLIEAVAREMGFRHWALIHHDDLRIYRPDRVDLKDYPAAIADRLIGQRRYRRDPIIRGCLFAETAFLWSDLHHIIQLDGKDRASFEFGAREGLNEGITCDWVTIWDPALSQACADRASRVAILARHK